MSSVIVLGAGMVGSAMAIDMAKSHNVMLTDINQSALNRAKRKCDSLKIQELNVCQTEDLQKLIKAYDLVICAVPGFLGFKTLKVIVEAGVNVVDISFFPENAFDLDKLAKEKGVTAIVDCGVAPGMGNLILGRYNEDMKISDFECLVGGLPKIKKWPFCYKAPFSPIDVIEEYTRPALYVENGKVAVREPLTDCEYVYFEEVGTLEAFNTDGLRSIIYTMPHIPNMKEKTMRYPGHVEYIKVLKESGFFSKDAIELNGVFITPRDFTSKILIDEWKLDEMEEEFTLMRVRLKGENVKGEKEEKTYMLHDKYCNESHTSSMARTTGYMATAVANLVLEGLFSEKGIIPPELIGKHIRCFDYILNYLRERNIHFKKEVRLI